MRGSQEKPFVSIVILNYNGEGLLGPCMDSVMKSRYLNFEIIVVDNASTDASIAEITRKSSSYANLSIVKNNYNFGFAEGNNIGAKHAKGDFLVFINNDTEVATDWLDHLVRTAIDDPFVGIVLPRVVWDASPEGLLVGNVDRFGNTVLVDMHSRAASREHSIVEGSNLSDRLSEVETIASGPAFLIKRKVWEEVGGFDPKYFIYAEDIDLSWRVKLLGYKTTVSKGSFVRHGVAGTTRKLRLDERRYLTYRNTIRTLVKDYSTGTLPKVMPPFLVIRLGEALTLSFIARNPKIVAGLARAIGWNIRHFSDSWTLHTAIQTRRTVSESEVQRVMARFSIAGLSSGPKTMVVSSTP